MRLELTLPALERLLGGDTEIEVHLRQQIIEEFTRKRLKSLLNDEVTRKLTQAWQDELRKEVHACWNSMQEQIAAKSASEYDAGFNCDGGFSLTEYPSRRVADPADPTDQENKKWRA